MRHNIAALATFAIMTASAASAGTPAEILAAYKTAVGGAAWDGKQAVSIDAEFNGQGLSGTTHILSDLKAGRSTNAYKFGVAEGASGYDGKTPWERDTSGAISRQQGGEAVQLAINDAYRTANLWWLPGFGGAAVEAKGEITDSTGRYDVLAITPKGGKTFEAWFDSASHMLVKVIEQQDSQRVVTTLMAYSEEGGVKLPHRLVIDNGLGAKYTQNLKVTKVTFLTAQPDSAFEPPKYEMNDFSIAGGAASTTIPIQLVNNHIYGEAKINGKGPYVFIFDTGGQDILTPPLAKSLGLKVEGNLPGTGAGEAVMEAGFTNGVDIEVGKAQVKNQVVIVLGLDKFGEIEGIPMPGMIGYEVFRRFVTQIDYGNSTLSLIDPTKFNPKDAGVAIPFIFNGHVPEIEGTIEGIPAKFDIDTGARSELTVTKPFAETNKLREKHPKGIDAVNGWGVGGPSTGFVTRLDTISLGPIKIDGVVTSLSDQSKGAFAATSYSANVGGGILKRFTVTFDYHNQLMYLKPSSTPVTDVGTYDRAGLWIHNSGTSFRIIAVTKGSPAAQAGLVDGDLVTAVDGRKAADIKLPDLRLRLRSDKPGTVVRFTVSRNGTQQEIAVTLRDLI